MNQHAITVRRDAQQLRKATLDTLALCGMCSIDLKRHYFVPVHVRSLCAAWLGAELLYLFRRAEPYDAVKDKSARYAAEKTLLTPACLITGADGGRHPVVPNRSGCR